MPLLTWLSLLFLMLALLGSITVAVLSGLRAWRAVRRFTRTTTSALGDVLQTAESAEEHAAALPRGAERLTAATTRLQASLAQLAALRSAAADARASLFSFRGAMPRK